MRAVPSGDLPVVTASQMREVDRILIEDLGIDLLQMMENAGRSLAALCVRRYTPATVVVLAGTGGNAGGGLAAARHLSNHGVRVTVVLAASAASLVPAAGKQLAILERMGVDVVDELPASQGVDVVVDALVGYSLSGAPRGRVAEFIGWANAQHVPVLSLDVPSGLDTGTGCVLEPCMRADATLTLAALKPGLLQAEAGELFLADISVPDAVFARLGVEPGVGFGRDWLLAVTADGARG